MADPPPPPPHGVRRPWSDVPERVRSALERWWGRRVVSAESLEGGFSPGVAARLTAAEGGALFVKAASSEPNPSTPEIHRREIAIASQLPADVPAPPLLWWHDEGAPGWVLLAFEALDGGSPALPWSPEALTRVVATLEELARTLTPNPLPEGLAEPIGEGLRSWFGGWRKLRDGGPTHRPLDRWSRRHLAELAAIEAGAGDAGDGDTLLHLDLRADNLVETADRTWIVDWPHVHVGAAWIDPLAMAPSVAMQGGPEPEAWLPRISSYRDADPERVTAVVAALAGFFTHRSLQPDPPGLPTVRAFQAAQGAAARRWLAERRGWEAP